MITKELVAIVFCCVCAAFSAFFTLDNWFARQEYAEHVEAEAQALAKETLKESLKAVYKSEARYNARGLAHYNEIQKERPLHDYEQKRVDGFLRELDRTSEIVDSQ